MIQKTNAAPDHGSAHGAINNHVHVSTLTFVKHAAPALASGFLLTFSSSFGQTFFLSLFGGVWREAFNLSHGAFGGLYAAATLASAASLLVLGKIVDQAAPSRIAFSLLILTAIAALWLSSASSVVTLGLGLFAMRVLGQGLLSHLAMTTMAKWFDAARGRALGIAMLGFPVGEAALPVAVAAAISAFGWRMAWIGVATFTALILTPIIIFLVKNAEGRDYHGDHNDIHTQASSRPSWRREDALRDWRFYAVSPGLLATPFIVTTVLFHQAHLIDVKGWTLGAFAGLFPLYAGFSIAAGLTVGRIVDAVGTRRVLPFFLLPLASGLLCVSVTNIFQVGALFMALMGATAGAATILYTAIWSELYGTDHLGAIRAVAVSAMVLSSAIGPALVGLALDSGFSLDGQLRVMAGVAIICAISLACIQNKLQWRAPPPYLKAN
ncbi:MAG: MFS transporter [Pseudomonadota bacterium]